MKIPRTPLRPRLDPEAEQSIREAHERRDFDRAITLAIEAYGHEIFSFLVSRLRAQSDAEEAFSMFTESLCHAMPAFEFRCSVRAYLYTLGRNSANRWATEPNNRRARNLSMSAHHSASAMIEQLRDDTQTIKRTDTKNRIRALRERLALEDQTLLILYVDRALPWNEIACVMNDAQALTGEQLVRESARLRKRFERVKAELRELAIAEGLIKR